MKKLSILFMAVLLMFVTGCSFGNKANSVKGVKTMTCTKEEIDENNNKTTDTMIITYNSEKVLKVDETTLAEMDPSYISMAYGLGSMFVSMYKNIDGLDASMEMVDNNKIKTIFNIDYDKLNMDQVRENLGNITSDADNTYSSNSYTIERFQENFLEGYSCK